MEARMDDALIVAIFTVIDDVMASVGHRTHALAQTSDSEVLTVAVIAACQFQNHQQRALCVMRGMRYLSGALSFSRFNRRLHALAHWFALALDLLCELFAFGTAAFALDSMPVPVCHRVRAGRCKKLRGDAYYGYCAAKKEKFFGWRLHLACTAAGVPVGFDLLPASLHDLNPVYDLAQCLPTGAALYGDKAYNSGDDEAWLAGEWGIRLVPIRKRNMTPNSAEEGGVLRHQRAVIEGVNSQLAAWGVQRLRARTHEGFVIKILASLLALVVVNAL
jgi:hypothetical protein